MTPENEEIAHASRRVAGFAALRRLRLLVDGDAAEERLKARWALRIGLGFAVAAGALVAWLLIRLG